MLAYLLDTKAQDSLGNKSPYKMPDPCDYAALLETSLVNRKFRRTAQEVLFSHVDLTRQPGRRTVLLLRTLTEREGSKELGRKTQALKMEFWRYVDEWMRPSMVKSLVEEVQGSGIPSQHKDRWIDGIRKCGLWRRLGAMFLLLPNLKEFDLTLAGAGFCIPSLDFLTGCGAFAHLRTLTLRNLNGSDLIHCLLETAQLLSSRSLKTLELVSGPRNQTCESAVPNEVLEKDWTCNIEQLRLFGFFANNLIERLVARCNRLRSLSYTAWPEGHDIQGIFDTALAAKDTLEDLTFRIKSAMHDPDSILDPARYSLHLDQYPNLRRVEVGGMPGVSPNCLPPVIEEFRFTPDRTLIVHNARQTADLGPDFLQFLRNIPQYLPSLRKVVVSAMEAVGVGAG